MFASKTLQTDQQTGSGQSGRRWAEQNTKNGSVLPSEPDMAAALRRRDGDEKQRETQAGELKTVVWGNLARLTLILDVGTANQNHLIRVHQRRRYNQHT